MQWIECRRTTMLKKLSKTSALRSNKRTASCYNGRQSDYRGRSASKKMGSMNTLCFITHRQAFSFEDGRSGEFNACKNALWSFIFAYHQVRKRGPCCRWDGLTMLPGWLRLWGSEKEWEGWTVWGGSRLKRYSAFKNISFGRVVGVHTDLKRKAMSWGPKI